MPNRKGREFDSMSALCKRQRGFTLDQIYQGALQRQVELVGIAIDCMITIIAEEALKKGEDFKALKERGLIKDGIAEEQFNEVLRNGAATETISDDFIEKKVARLIKEGLLIDHNDLVAVDDISRYKTESKAYNAAMDEYYSSLKIVNKRVAEVLSSVEEYSAILQSYMSALLETMGGQQVELPRLPVAPQLPKEIDMPTPPEISDGAPFKRPEDPRVIVINRIGKGIIQIREAGIKNRIRTEEKIITKPLEEIKDITRISIIPSSPVMGDRFADLIEETRDHCDTGDTLRMSGYMNRDIGVEIAGLISEIQIVSEGQSEAYYVSHKIYGTLRRMENENDRSFNPELVTPVDSLVIMSEYNSLMREFKGDHPITIGLFKRGKFADFDFRERPISDFRGEGLSERYEELIRLHQAIHISAVVHELEHGKKEWGDKYMGLANTLNTTRESQGLPGLDMLDEVLKREAPPQKGRRR